MKVIQRNQLRSLLLATAVLLLNPGAQAGDGPMSMDRCAMPGAMPNAMPGPMPGAMPPPGAPEFAMAGMPMPPYLRGLRLSDAQEDAIQDIFLGQARALRERARTIAKADEELRAMSLATDFDEARARALIDASSNAMAQLKLMRLRADRQILALLSPEQRRQLTAAKNEPDAKAMPPKFGAGPGQGRPGGPDGDFPPPRPDYRQR
jgi:Spy/CpxP family protein refolding chaperone